MDNEGIYQVIPGNVTFLQGCAASLAGQESAVLIDSQGAGSSSVGSARHCRLHALGLLFVIVLPAALLAVGAVVVVLRRRK